MLSAEELRLVTQTRARIDVVRSAALAKGRATGIIAFKQAIERLGRSESEFVLIGGVDSLVDLYVLGTLDMQGRIRNEVNSDGFSPSEGAAFLLLCTAEAAVVETPKASHKQAPAPRRGAQTSQGDEIFRDTNRNNGGDI